MYTHYARKTDTTDKNGDYLIEFVWSSAQKYEVTADDVELGEGIRQAHITQYIDKYDGSPVVINGNSLSYYENSLDELRAIRKAQLKAVYLSDALWSDDSNKYYDKLVRVGENTPEDDAWIAEINAHWWEAQLERRANKAAIKGAANQAALDAIGYNPTHAKTRKDVE